MNLVCTVPVGTSGTVTLTHANAGGCSNQASTSVSAVPSPGSPILSTAGPVCTAQGAATAPITITYVLPNGASVGDSFSPSGVDNFDNCEQTTSADVSDVPILDEEFLALPSTSLLVSSTAVTFKSVCDVPAGTQASVTVTHAAANGCSQTSAPVSVTVNVPPSKPVGAPSNPLCTNTASAEVTATFTLPDGASVGDGLTFVAPSSYTGCTLKSAGGKQVLVWPRTNCCHPEPLGHWLGIYD